MTLQEQVEMVVFGVACGVTLWVVVRASVHYYDDWKAKRLDKMVDGAVKDRLHRV